MSETEYDDRHVRCNGILANKELQFLSHGGTITAAVYQAGGRVILLYDI
jgi:hypothetical protein